MNEKKDYSKKILKILSENKAVSLPDLANQISESASETPKTAYAIARSLKALVEGGLVESHSSGRNEYARLTQTGRRKATSLKLENGTAILNPHWDGKWRIILLDLPESRKSERESLRYLLKKAGFVLLKNSAWISPFPFEHLFMNIKKDLGLSTEMMILVTSDLDTTTEEEMKQIFRP